MTTNTTNMPARKIRLGQVAATIWEQESGFYTATLERTYKDKKGHWQSTNSFSVDDLIVVAYTASLAAQAILELANTEEE